MICDKRLSAEMERFQAVVRPSALYGLNKVLMKKTELNVHGGIEDAENLVGRPYWTG